MFKYTIITTVKNGINFIDDCLTSVNNQSYKNFIHIIIDDNSSDNSFEYLNDKYTANNRIIIKNSLNPGRVNSLNMALSKIQTPYICILDIDDMVHPDWLKFSDYWITKYKIDIITSKYSNSNIFNNFTNSKIIHVSSFFLLFRNFICHSGVIINYSKMSDSIKYEDSINHDYKLWINLSILNFKITYIPLCLVYHRIHDLQNFEKNFRFKYVINSFLLKSKFLFSKFPLLIPLILPIQLYGILHSLLKGYLKRTFF